MMGKQASSSEAAKGVPSTYTNLCASCHGAKGKGDGPAAMALNPRPRDFSDCKEMASHSDDYFYKIIKGGGQSVGRSPLMPPWGGSLNDQQVSDLVAYIRGFCKK